MADTAELSRKGSGVIPPRRLVRVVDDADDGNSQPPALDSLHMSQRDSGHADSRSVDATPRRIAFPLDQEQSFDASPSSQPFSPSRLRGARAHVLNSVRMSRREFYENIGPKRSAFSFCSDRNFPLRCSGLSSVAAALSYMSTCSGASAVVSPMNTVDAASPGSDPRSKPGRINIDSTQSLTVTVDSLLRTCELPLSWLTDERMSIHTAHDIVTRVVQHRSELSDFEVLLEPMDLKITEVLNNPLDDFDSAPREPAVDLKNLRRRLLETQASHNFAVIVFYDQQLVADSLTVEEDEGVDLEMNKSFLAAMQTPDAPAADGLLDVAQFRDARTKTEAAVVVGLTRNDRVQLAVPKFSAGRSGMQILEVQMPVLHRGMCALHPYSGRANGFIVVRRIVPTEGRSRAMSMSESLSSPDHKPAEPPSAPGTQSPRVAPNRLAFSALGIFGKRLASPAHIQLHNVPACVGPHITAMAVADALLSGGGDCGVNLNAVVSKLRCPFEHVCQGTLSVEDVGSMCRTVFADRDLSVTIVPFAQNLRRVNAPCALPVSEFQAALEELKVMNASRPNGIMLIQFNVCFAHWTVDINHGDAAETHWGIVSDIDLEDDRVEVIDMLPSKYGFVWSTDIEQLHRSMNNYGFVLVSRETIVHGSPFLPSAETTVVDIAQSLPPYSSPLVANSSHCGVGASVQPDTPLSLAGLAAAHRTPNGHFSGLLAAAPVSVAHMLDDRLGLFDYASASRLGFLRSGIKVGVSVQRFQFSLHSMMTGSESRTAFDELVDGSPKSPQRAVVFHYLRPALTGHHIRELKGPAQQCKFALLIGPVGEDCVALLGVSRSACTRRWVTTRTALFDAVSAVCPQTQRPMGAVVYDFDAPPAHSTSLESPMVAQQMSAKPAAADEVAQPSSLQPREIAAQKTRLVANWNRFGVPAAAPFSPSVVPVASAVAMGCTALGIARSAEEIVYCRAGADDGEDATDATDGTDATDEFAATKMGASATPATAMKALADRFFEVSDMPYATEMWSAVDESRLMSLLRETEVTSEGACKSVLLVAYAPRMVHESCPDRVTHGCAIVTSFTVPAPSTVTDDKQQGPSDDDVSNEPIVTLADADPSTFGDEWSLPAAELVTAMRESGGLVRLKLK